MRSDSACRRLSEVLTATGGVEPPPGDDLDHLRQCLRCQATAVRLRRLGRALESLEDERYEPPPDLLPDTLRLLRSGEQARRRRARARAELAALAAAGAAAGALVLGRRLRHVAS
ncbi:MAG: hypothetical protein AAGA17_07540 [Actinomycetota bacterium]